MKLSISKSIATAAAAVLVASIALVSVPAASAAAPTCTTAAGVETCKGTLANGATYEFRMPANFKGTMFFWEHGFQSTYPGVSKVPTGI